MPGPGLSSGDISQNEAKYLPLQVLVVETKKSTKTYNKSKCTECFERELWSGAVM